MTAETLTGSVAAETRRALRDAALAYAARGWRVFPLHTAHDGQCSCGSAKCSSPGKHPRTPRGFKDASTDALMIRRWWRDWPDANVGIATGGMAGIVVLDVDGPSGARTLKDNGGAPPTPQVKTGKGAHFYFRHPGHPVACSAGKLPGIDVRGDGGYVVAPPSIHVFGHAYVWLVDPNTELAEPPGWLMALAGASKAPRSRSKATPVRGISEGARNDTLYRLGRSLHARDAATGTIRAALHAENRARCRPPLADREVDAIAAHVATQADRDDFTSAPDAADDDAEVPDVADESTDEEELFSEPVSALLEGKLPAIRWFVKPMLAVGNSGFIGAEPKVGKSWLGLDLARCVASGVDFLGYHVPKARRVLYIQEEDSRRRVSSRLRRLVKGAGDSPPTDEMLRVIVRRGFRIDQPNFQKSLRQELSEFQPALVVVDVFNSVHTKDELNQQQMTEVLRAFTRLNRKYGCAFLLLHHFRKASPMPGRAPRGGQMLRGSSALHGWSENSLYLTPSGERSFYVEVESKDASCESFEVEIVDDEDGGVRLESGPIFPTSAKAAEKDWASVVKLFDKKQTVAVSDVAKAIDRTKKTAQGRLKKWVEQGRLEEECLDSGGPNGTFIYRVVKSTEESPEGGIAKGKKGGE